MSLSNLKIRSTRLSVAAGCGSPPLAMVMREKGMDEIASGRNLDRTHTHTVRHTNPR